MDHKNATGYYLVEHTYRTAHDFSIIITSFIENGYILYGNPFVNKDGITTQAMVKCDNNV